MSLVDVVCCQVEVSASGRSLVQWSHTECGVSECDREASILRRPWPTGGCYAMVKRNVIVTAGFILVCGCLLSVSCCYVVVIVGFVLLCSGGGGGCRFRTGCGMVRH